MARSLKQIRASSVKKGLLRLERHSGTGRLGAPKKGGGGAKYTWGVPGYNDDADFALVDKMDPNFDEDEDVLSMLSRKMSDLTN